MRKRLLESSDKSEGRGWPSIRQHAARVARPGPSTLEELFQWPERILDDLGQNVAIDGSDGEGDARMLRLRIVLERRLALDSLYSGFDCPRWALSPTVARFIQKYSLSSSRPPLEFCSACDWGEVQQRVLCHVSHTVDSMTSCVFGNNVNHVLTHVHWSDI